jgi:SAM-dependent methyltransferase
VTIGDKDARARSFGQVADVDDRGRPGWPAEAIEWLRGPEPRAVPTQRAPEVALGDGRVEELAFDDASFGALVAGSALHWFDRDPTLDEIGRVLRPPGVFGLLGSVTTPRSTGGAGWRRWSRPSAPGAWPRSTSSGRASRSCAGASPPRWSGAAT